MILECIQSTWSSLVIIYGTGIQLHICFYVCIFDEGWPSHSDAVPPAQLGRNFEFIQGARDNSRFLFFVE